MIDYTRPYTASWRVMRVDPVTWQSVEEIPGAVSATISRDCTDDVPLLETASIEMDDPSIAEGWHRIEAVVTQGQTEVVPLCTVLLAAGGGTFSKGVRTEALTGYSVLQPAADMRFAQGTYAPKGANGAHVAELLLREVTPAPVELEGGFTLSDHVVFDLGASYLEGIWSVLDSAGWCIRIAEDGTIRICPRPDGPGDTPQMSPALMMPGVDYEPATDVPNVYIAIDGDSTAEAVNSDPASPTSTVSRGRRVVEVDSSPMRMNGESLQRYAERMLVESRRTVLSTYTYEREYYPGIVPFDILGMHVPGLIDSRVRVLSQEIGLGLGIRVSETVGLEGLA